MRGGRAVVVGAGIAGLSSARVLADRFGQVVVLDRDELPDTPRPRRGVPQGAHGHVLLAAGQRALNRLFPGLDEELVSAGAVPFDPGVDLAVFRLGAFWVRVETGVRVVSLSRPMLELALRRRVTALPNVTIRPATAVSGLIGDSERVTGVTTDAGELPADLVVDCSGRGGRSDRWLAALGLPTPQVSEIKIRVGYTTRLLRRNAHDLPGGAAAFVLPTFPGKRVGLLIPIEDERWLVSMGAWHGDFEAADETGFRRHARSLAHPVIADLLESAEPLTDLVSCGFPSSRRWHYERLRRVPAGYLATGDAICSFNPVYGQGMTCAAMQAVALGRTLDRHGAATAKMVRDFYRAAARIIAIPWRFSAGGDFGYPETTGPKPPATDLLNWYSRKIQLAAQVSPFVRRRFQAVQQLVMTPAALFGPSMVVRALIGARRAPGPRPR